MPSRIRIVQSGLFAPKRRQFTVTRADEQDRNDHEFRQIHEIVGIAQWEGRKPGAQIAPEKREEIPSSGLVAGRCPGQHAEECGNHPGRNVAKAAKATAENTGNTDQDEQPLS